MRKKVRIAAAIVVLAVGMTATFAVIESLATDEPTTPGDIAVDFLEALCIAAAMFSSAIFISRLKDVEAETASLRQNVAEASAAGAAWRRQSQRLLEGIGEAITLQFHDWRLTEAECDVAGLILKGMSLKVIARARATSETTIRQQAQSVYRKSGLGNRAELAAYCLDDLFVADGGGLAPPEQRAPLT
jgi:DNA-binding NarL/FixJ family response regulator